MALARQQSDAERGIRSGQTLKIGRNETSNIEVVVRGKCHLFNRPDGAAGRMAEWIEGAGRHQRGRARGPSGRIGQETCDPVKGITDWEGRH
jgi:hypothetical protein